MTETLDLLFYNAHTFHAWQDRKIAPEILEKLHTLTHLGPTSANCCPLRLVFISSPDAKERLKPYLDQGNVEQTMTAPVTAILAYDTEFYDHLPKLYPFADARAWFAGNEAAIFNTAFRNSSLQGGYFILAARALGLDCGPMSGFDQKGLDAEFFPDGRFKSNFLCNLGYGAPEGKHARAPRLTFDEACHIL